MSADDPINAYLDRVCLHIHWPPYRKRVRRELYDHICSCAEYLSSQRGFPYEEAVLQAIYAMGDPEALGHDLHYTYRPYRQIFIMLITVILWAVIAYCVILLLLHLPR